MVMWRRLIIVFLSALLFTTTFNASAPSASVAKAKGQIDTSCGITKTDTGYSFERLHTENGNIVAASGCIINLKGFNLPGTGYGNAIGDTSPNRLSNTVIWFAQNFKMNFWRVSINAVWWNEDVLVPTAGMHYRAWIQHVIQLLENNGNYVLFLKGSQFHEPPCGGTVTYCPAQNQASKDIKKDPNNPVYQHQVTTGEFIDDAITMWKSVAPLYANDPAILYGAWNEMHRITPELWRQNEGILIDTIQTQNPQALVFFGGNEFDNGFGPLIKGKVPAFTQSNLVYDFHVYDGFDGTFEGKPCSSPMSILWSGWPDKANVQVAYAKAHGAASFSEWGGCKDTEPYNTQITRFAAANHVVLGYYEKNMVINGHNPPVLNANGLKAQAAYASY